MIAATPMRRRDRTDRGAVTRCSVAIGIVVSLVSFAAGAEGTITPQITVDQFGWLPGSAKVAILADPVKGQNAGGTYQPGDRFEIRREPQGTTAFRGTTRP